MSAKWIRKVRSQIQAGGGGAPQVLNDVYISLHFWIHLKILSIIIDNTYSNVRKMLFGKLHILCLLVGRGPRCGRTGYLPGNLHPCCHNLPNNSLDSISLLLPSICQILKSVLSAIYSEHHTQMVKKPVTADFVAHKFLLLFLQPSPEQLNAALKPWPITLAELNCCS